MRIAFVLLGAFLGGSVAVGARPYNCVNPKSSGVSGNSYVFFGRAPIAGHTSQDCFRELHKIEDYLVNNLPGESIAFVSYSTMCGGQNPMIAEVLAIVEPWEQADVHEIGAAVRHINQQSFGQLKIDFKRIVQIQASQRLTVGEKRSGVSRVVFTENVGVSRYFSYLEMCEARNNLLEKMKRPSVQPFLTSLQPQLVSTRWEEFVATLSSAHDISIGYTPQYRVDGGEAFQTGWGLSAWRDCNQLSCQSRNRIPESN